MMFFAVAAVIFAGLVWTVFQYFIRLVGDERPDTRRWFWTWVAKGLAVPLVIWITWNLGVLPGLPALMPQIAQAQSGGGPWFPAFIAVLSSALLVIGSYWAAI